MRIGSQKEICLRKKVVYSKITQGFFRRMEELAKSKVLKRIFYL